MVSALAMKIMEAGWDAAPAYAASWVIVLGTPVALWLLFSWIFA